MLEVLQQYGLGARRTDGQSGAVVRLTPASPFDLFAGHAGVDLYEVLGVSNCATPAEIKIAFRRLAKSLHPDCNAGNKTAEQHFAVVHYAYTILGNHELRAAYDRELEVDRANAAIRMAAATFQHSARRRGRVWRAAAEIAVATVVLTVCFVTGISIWKGSSDALSHDPPVGSAAASVNDVIPPTITRAELSEALFGSEAAKYDREESPSAAPPAAEPSPTPTADAPRAPSSAATPSAPALADAQSASASAVAPNDRIPVEEQRNASPVATPGTTGSAEEQSETSPAAEPSPTASAEEQDSASATAVASVPAMADAKSDTSAVAAQRATPPVAEQSEPPPAALPDDAPAAVAQNVDPPPAPQLVTPPAIDPIPMPPAPAKTQIPPAAPAPTDDGAARANPGNTVPATPPARSAAAIELPGAGLATSTSSTEPPAPPSRRNDPSVLKQAERFIRLGERYLAHGNIAIARQYFSRAADLGLSLAAAKLAETFEKEGLARHGVLGVKPDPAEAARWRKRALELRP